MTDPAQTKCPFCDKQGLPILPLRYAVARADVKTKAPQLQAPFGKGIEDVELPDATAQYTLRLLRPGYLYVFNEKRGEWSAYVTTERGYLYQFDPHTKSPPAADKIEFACSRTGDAEIARCITVPDAARAGKVWLGFTDTAWTPDVLQRHAKESYRKRHMRSVDVGKWAGGGADQPHATQMSKIDQLVAEFAFKRPEQPKPQPKPSRQPSLTSFGLPSAKALPPGPWSLQYIEEHSFQTLDTVVVTVYPTFASTPHHFVGMQEDAVAQIDWANRVATPCTPMMVALHDPAGITMELASLMSDRLSRFMQRPELLRPLAVSSAITSLKQVVQKDAEVQALRKAEVDARHALDVGYMGGGDGGNGARAGMALAEAFSPKLAESRRQQAESLKKITPEQLNIAQAEAWGKYEKKYREPARAAWQKSYEASLKKLDSTVIVPLAKAHKSWMKSDALASAFECNHDENSADSGQAYIDTLLLCIQDTQQNKISFDLYVDWLNDSQVKRDNLVLRALAYNQGSVVAQLNQAAGGGLKAEALKGLPWDGLIAGYDKALQSLAQGGRNAVARLLVSLGGPFMSVIDKGVDRMIGPGLIGLGLVARAPGILVDRVASKAEVIQELVARMKALNPRVGSLPELNRAIELELRRAEIRGVPMNGTGRFRYLIMADPQVVADFPGVDAAGNARRFARGAILTAAEYQEKTQLRWQRLMASNIRLGIVTSLLQTMALTKLANDVDGSMRFESRENQWRYSAGVTALVGTLGGLTGEWMENAAAVGNRLAMQMENLAGTIVRGGAKALGFIAGGIMAVWDGVRANQEWNEGNEGVAVLYGLSAVAGVGAMIAFSGWAGLLLGSAATGIGIVLVVVAILIAVLIEYFKDNKLQDWMERCLFGSFGERDRYQEAECEMKELQIAMKG